MMRDVWFAVILTCGGRKICTAASKKFALTLGPKRRRVQAIIEQRSHDRQRPVQPTKFLVIPSRLIFRASMRSGTASFISTATGVLSAWAGIDRRSRPQPLPFPPLRSRLVAAAALLLGVY